ncbi:hypothetical protein [Streptomyces echinatus]|uniref:hypothetical protein n=1 Tax=Streptomyces echinatus TaxID=67293 RepID=UPI0031EB5E46
MPTAVLAGRDASGAPLLARTRPQPTPSGYLVEVSTGLPCRAGAGQPAGARHDELLNHMYNALVRGDLRAERLRAGSW